MGLYGENNTENEQTGQISTEIQEAKQGKEVQREMASHTKKKYMYIAINREGEVLLGEKKVPYFKTAEEGSALCWPQEIKKIAITDPELRVELAEGNGKNDREKARKDAKEKLMALAADKIQDAIAKREEKRNNNINGEDSQEGKTKTDKIVETAGKEDIVSVETSTVDLALIVETIKSAEKNLNQDFNDFLDVVQESMGKTGNENVDEIKMHAESKTRCLEDTVRKCMDDLNRHATERTQRAVENIIGRINEESKSLKKGQEEIISSEVKKVQEINKDTKEAIEGMEGKLSPLKQLDQIVELLQNKGLTMSMDIPPVNAEEEDIINLVRYSQKITEQLGYAARDLLRKQVVFQSRDQNNANEQSIIERKIADAHGEGVKEGQKLFIKQLVSKYADIDALKDSDDERIHVIWGLLTELGVQIDADGTFEKGNKVSVSDEEAHRMMGIYTKIDGAGKYRVLKTGLVYSGEIIYKAEFEKIETHQEETEEQVNEKPQF